MWDESKFIAEFNSNGYAIVPDVLDADFIRQAKVELASALKVEDDYRKKNPLASDNERGMVLLCSIYGGSFLKLFENEKFLRPFNAILGSGCIVYAYTSSSMPPSGTNYSSRIHVDSPRLIPNYVTNMGSTLLLDDFTEENGATWFLPGSHTQLNPPTESDFRKNSKRLVAKAGSVWFFNARLWHAGGVNQSESWRHALTLNMCRPYMKQRIDIPRAMKDVDLTGVSETTLQKLGFLSQIPASYDEYYAPPEKRKFRQKQE